MSALGATLPARYSDAMRLHLGDDGEPGPILGHVKPEDWDKLADGQKTGRWIAFSGDQATVWLRLDARDGLTVATGMFVWSAEPLTVKSCARSR